MTNDNGAQRLAMLWKMGMYSEFIQVLWQLPGLTQRDLEGCSIEARLAAWGFSGEMHRGLRAPEPNTRKLPAEVWAACKEEYWLQVEKYEKAQKP